MSKLSLTVACDQERTVRVDLESGRYGAGDEGLRFGWDLSCAKDAETIELLFDDLAIPTWASGTNDDLADILRGVTAILLRPLPEGLLGSGYLPPGSTDPGWLQVDDLSLTTGQ